MSLVLEDALRAHVHALAGGIGERHPGRPTSLARARDHLRRTLAGYGLDARLASPPGGGPEAVEALFPGGAPGLLALEARYDSPVGAPGADAWASGAAVLLELGRLLRGRVPRPGVLLRARAGPGGGPSPGADLGRVRLDAVGFLSRAAGSQSAPPLIGALAPSRGDFLALLHGLSSWGFARRLAAALRPRLSIPLRRVCLPGLPCAVLTDTGSYRNPHWGGPGDLPDTLDYPAMAALAEALAGAVQELAA